MRDGGVDILRTAEAVGAQTPHDRYLYQRLVEWRAQESATAPRVTPDHLRLAKFSALLLRHGRFFPCPCSSEEPTSFGTTSESYALAQSLTRLHGGYEYAEGFVLSSPHGTPVEQAWCVRDDGRTVDSGGIVLSRLGVVFDRSFAVRRHAPCSTSLRYVAAAAPSNGGTGR